MSGRNLCAEVAGELRQKLEDAERRAAELEVGVAHGLADLAAEGRELEAVREQLAEADRRLAVVDALFAQQAAAVRHHTDRADAAERRAAELESHRDAAVEQMHLEQQAGARISAALERRAAELEQEAHELRQQVADGGSVPYPLYRRAVERAWEFRRHTRRAEQEVHATARRSADMLTAEFARYRALQQQHAALLAQQAAHPALTTPPICGNTGLTEDVEARFREIRAEKGESQEGGCGKQLGWIHAYRCLTCGRFMHAECLRQHFAEHGDRTAAIARDLELAQQVVRAAQAWQEADAARSIDSGEAVYRTTNNYLEAAGNLRRALAADPPWQDAEMSLRRTPAGVQTAQGAEDEESGMDAREAP